MKIKSILLGTLFVGLAASCSDDLTNEKGGQILENETTTFIRLSLVGDLGTRAIEEEGYEPGTVDESAVNSILLTFFDEDKTYVGKTYVNPKESQDDQDMDFNGDGNTVERILTVTTSVTLPQNSKHPKYIIAYVNPTSAHADLATDKMDEALRVIRNRDQVSPQNYRTMNNSMYFNNSGDITYATTVDFAKCFFKTKEEAAKASDDKSIFITVERMEAKVRLTTPLSNLAASAQGNSAVEAGDYSLEFVPEAWFVNGTEKRSFLLKNYRYERKNWTASLNEDKRPFTLTELNSAFTGRATTFTVNDQPNKRSYWAIDPTYFYEDNGADYDIYPAVSYDVKYGESINPTGNDYQLIYRSYTEAADEYKAHKSTNYVKFNETVKTHEYVLENTMSHTTLRSTDAKAAMTSVVLLGHYVVKQGSDVVYDGGSTVDKKTGFYVRHEDNNTRKVMLFNETVGDRNAIEFLLEQNTSLLYVQQIDLEGNPVADTYVPLKAAHLSAENAPKYGVSLADFELVYPSNAVSPEKIESEQWRTLNIKNKSEKIFIQSTSEGVTTYTPLSALSVIDFAALKLNLYSQVGKIEKFQSGRSYFNVPLKHFQDATLSTSNEYKPETVRLGDYGVVRNHIYDLSINKITGLGTGIGDVDQPIVPPTENELYYINTKLNILKWKLVKQSVDL